MIQNNITAFRVIYNKPQTGKTTQMSRWVDEQIMVHPYGRILLSNRKEQTTAHGEGKGSQKCYTEEKKRYGRVQAARFNLHEIPEKAKRICNDRMHRSMSTCTWAGDGRRDSKGWGMRKFWGMMEMFYIFLSSFWTYIFIPFLYRILSSWNIFLFLKVFKHPQIFLCDKIIGIFLSW